MKISDSNIQLSSAHQQVQRIEERESLEVFRNGRSEQVPRGRLNIEQMAVALEASFQEIVISTEAKSLQPTEAVLFDSEEPTAEDDLKIMILQRLIESLTGKKIELFVPNSLAKGSDVASLPETETNASGFGLVYDHYQSHYELEKTQFNATGQVKTEDGKTIDIAIALNMSREFFTENQTHIEIGQTLKDPLVVNFNASAAALTERKFEFDIDSDGKLDQMSFVKPGSGFLALDKNSNGQVDNGNELFGTQSGNGFADLAAYDDDNNEWIDENDGVYDRLRIWSKDSDGNDQLIALGQRDIGAIYLGHVSTPFLLKDSENETLGAVRDSGLFIKDSGGAGSVQQVDLVV